MKNINNPHLFGFLAVAMIISCSAPQPDNELPLNSHPDDPSRRQHPSAPVSNTEYEILTGAARIAFRVDHPNNPGNYQYIDKVQPKIALQDFIRYFTDQTNGSFEGIRIYPALKNGYLVFIMCRANHSNNQEAAYLLLQNDSYLNNTLTQAAITADSADFYHNDYLNKVKIFFHSQNTTGTPLEGRLRYSRFYRNTILNNYITVNLPEPSEDIPDPMSDTRIMLEFGYILDEFVGNLQGRIPNEVFTDNELQGVTVLFHLQGSNEARYIDRTKIYNRNSGGDYKDLYLEVGVPCPPRCGALH